MFRLLTALALAAFVAGAGPAAAQTPPGVLVVGQVAEPKSLDPHVDTAVNDFRILVNVYDGLVRYKDGTLEVEPSLAESYEVSDDGLVYTFTLRDGVTFHDGTPLDAEAIVFNFERMLDENHPYHDTGPFPLSFFFSAIDTVEAVDGKTVRFTLKEPYAPFLSNLAYPTGLIVSPEAVKTHGKDFGRNPVGTGAYKFAEWQSNSRVVVEKNPDYWDGAPALEAVVFRPITDANTRLAEMMAGGIDVMVETPPDALKSFGEDPSFTVYEQGRPAPVVPDPQRQGRPVPRSPTRSRAPRRPTMRSTSPRAGGCGAAGHGRCGGGTDAAGLRLGLQRGAGALPA
ncbi:MAG: hypothetical protein AcusKO_37280 [Acuticoccus sp.]